jgi:outer membrane receptor protein involved in Fe transport
MIADTGHIHLEYAEANATRLDFNFHYIPASALRISGTASAVSAHETGSDVQLPMTPQFLVRGRAETDGPAGTTLWSTVEYQSSRNVDRLGTQSLKDIFLLNAGGSLHTIPRLVLAAEIRNLFNLSYDWWAGYPAPGINLNVTAKFNIQ